MKNKYAMIITHFKKVDPKIAKYMSKKLFDDYLPSDVGKKDDQYYFER